MEVTFLRLMLVLFPIFSGVAGVLDGAVSSLFGPKPVKDRLVKGPEREQLHERKT